MTSWSGPKFLSEQHEPTYRIRCPVHGFIRYSELERLVIDHSVFQRLRNIRQLAFTHYVYPGAVHTRFEHSLGVMELATQIFDALCLRHAGLLEDSLKNLPELSTDTLAKARQLVRLLGLLHDVGHTAFSHAGERLLPGGRHELLSAWVGSREGPLGPLLDQRFFEGAADLLEKMLLVGATTDPAKQLPPQLLVLTRIVSGELDADRTDYLLRDSLYCGVDYGRFDHRRMIQTLLLHDDPATQSVAVGIDYRGYHTVEALLMARYYMNTQVYFHRVRRAYDLLLHRWLAAWRSNHDEPLDKALQHDDLSLLAEMRRDAAGENGSERQTWAERILRRNHPRVVYETTDHADALDLTIVRGVHDQLRAEFPDYEFFLDEEARGWIHKLYVRGDQEYVDDLFVVDRYGRRSSFSTWSRIVEKIPKQFWVIRISGYFPSRDERERASQRARELATNA